MKAMVRKMCCVSNLNLSMPARGQMPVQCRINGKRLENSGPEPGDLTVPCRTSQGFQTIAVR